MNKTLNGLGEETEVFSQANFMLLEDGNIEMTLWENGRKKQRYIQDYISISYDDAEQIKRYERVGYKLLWSSDLGKIPANLTSLISKNGDKFEDYRDFSDKKGYFNRGLNIEGKQSMAISGAEGKILYFIKSTQLHPQVAQEVVSIKKILQDFFAQIGATK
ncbi:MAG: hypothetical protein AB7E37_00025 [Candidatus Altimarinota bacterium]